MNQFNFIPMQCRSIIVSTCVVLLVAELGFGGQWKTARSLMKENGVESILVQVLQQRNDYIILKYKTPSPRFQPVAYQSRGGMSAVRCAQGNARLHSQPGEPEVPYINGRLFLPQGRIIESIRVIPNEIIELPKKYLLTYGEIPHPLSAKEVVWAKPDQTIYESDNVYPAQTHELTSIQYRCGVAVGCIDLYPVRYLPKSGKISYYKTFTLEVRTKPDTRPGTGVRVRLDRIKNGFLTEENPEALNTYVDGSLRGDYQHVLCNPAQSYSYVAITAQSFIDAATDPNLDDLIALRELKGFTCKVESIETILTEYRGRDDADKLRDFIKDAYNNWETGFVLLGGDIDIIPLETVYASNGQGDDIPTDIPYQCLDQATWDDDWEAEVMIGRFSAEDETEFSNQIYKTIAYETDPLSEGYLTKGLSLGEELDASTYAKDAMIELQGYFPTPDDFSFDGLYDEDGDWSKSELIDMYNTSAYSIADHFGHSSYTRCMKMSNGDETKLTNDKFVFVKSQGCMPGGFDRDCFAERLTTSTRTGMFAVVFNARYGWYSPGSPTGGSSHKVHRSMWQACWEQDMDYFSEFNEYSHRVNTRYEWDILESNLLGDPATLFRGKEVPPFVQVVSPNGGERWEQDRTFNIRWDDNVDDEVKIELLKGNTIAEVLAASVPSNGSFPWDIAADFPLGTDYKIIVSSTVNDTLIDTSDDVFAIEEKSNLELTAPNGGEVIEKDSEVEITWDDDLDGEIKIDLFKSGKILVNVIPSTPSNGSYTWKVPENIISGSDYKVRVASVEKDWLYDDSNDTLTIKNPIITLFPYVQDFDAFDTNSTQLRQYWEQLDGDDLDWTVWTGMTPTKYPDQGAATGPDGDHTSGDGNYLYVESSGSNNPDKKADLISPIFNLSPLENGICTFWYHMFSDNEGEDQMGDLYVDMNVDGTWEEGVLHFSGDNGDIWKSATIDLKDYHDKMVQFRFRDITGSGWASDVCIDDFKIDGEVIAAPVITKNPEDQTVDEGTTATFTVEADGVAPVTYQWQANDSVWEDIAGATDASYITPVLVPADSGTNYRCIASNKGGSDTSDAAMLKVKAITPIIYDPDVGDDSRFVAGPSPADRNSDGIRFRFEAENVSEAQLNVYDALGNEVYADGLTEGKAQWDLYSEEGRKVACGVYVAVLWVTYTNGTIEQIKKNIGVTE